MRNKGKVHPLSSSSSSSSNSSNKESFSVLNLLPAAIFTLVSVLPLEDREVLAYMITRSLKSTNPSFFPADDKKRSSKKQSFDCHGHSSPALFDCDCFDCYTSFWFRWDSSPNREVIHQAIEAFEEHLNNGEQLIKESGNGKNKRKEKMIRRKGEKLSAAGGVLETTGAGPPANQESLVLVSQEKEEAMAESDNMEPGCREGEMEDDVVAWPPSAVAHNHKGLAKKVLPDVMGIFNSRWWSLWSPNV